MTSTWSAVAVIMLCSWPQWLHQESSPLLVLWNVGQGQWVTYVETSTCLHFDMGGEFAPWRSIKALCQGKNNEVYFTHGDWDHIRHAFVAKKIFKNLCRRNLPVEELTPKKSATLQQIPPCSRPPKNYVTEIPPKKWLPAADANELSFVFLLGNKVVIAGDGGEDREHQWLRELPEGFCPEVLIVGHHGSRTSTSDELLKTLPCLKMAWVSARKERYGHPHAEVLRKLSQAGIAVLTTESWNNIQLELSLSLGLNSGI